MSPVMAVSYAELNDRDKTGVGEPGTDMVWIGYQPMGPIHTQQPSVL